MPEYVINEQSYEQDGVRVTTTLIQKVTVEKVKPQLQFQPAPAQATPVETKVEEQMKDLAGGKVSPLTFKLIFVGDAATGKTTFVKTLQKHLAKMDTTFEPMYVATVGADVHPIQFTTSAGVVKFVIWDTAGDEKLGGLRDGYYLGADAVIYFYDRTSAPSEVNLRRWRRDINRVCGDIPYCTIANKYDLDSALPRSKVVGKVFNVSAKYGYEWSGPIFYLLRELLGRDVLILSDKQLQTDIKPKVIWQATNTTPTPANTTPTAKKDDPAKDENFMRATYGWVNQPVESQPAAPQPAAPQPTPGSPSDTDESEEEPDTDEFTPEEKETILLKLMTGFECEMDRAENLFDEFSREGTLRAVINNIRLE